MNRFIMLMAYACIAAVTLAQTPAAPDTIAAIDRPGRVTVITDGNKTDINVAGSGEDASFTYTYSVAPATEDTSADIDSDFCFNLPFRPAKGHDTYWRAFNYIYAGVNIPLAEKRLGCSWEIGVAEVIGRAWASASGKTVFSVGAGFGCSRFNTRGNNYFVKEGQKLGIEHYQSGECDVRAASALDMWSIKVPVMLHQNVGGDWAFDFGAWLSLNTYVRASSTIRNDDRRHTEKFTGLHQRFLSVEPVAMFGYDGCAIYVKYDPLSIFHTQDGPAARALSAGVCFMF